MKWTSARVVGRTAAVALLACLSAARAADTEWVAGEGNWDLPPNWSSGRPDGDDNAYISNGGTALILTSDAFAAYVHVGYGEHEEGHVRQTGYEADFDRLYVGYLEGSTGTYVLDGGVLNTNGTDIGQRGNGLFRQNAGSHYCMGTLDLGHAYPWLRCGNQGVYVLVDGYLNALGLTCGGNGTAIFRQYGGIFRLDGHAGIGGRDCSASLELLEGEFFAHGVTVREDGQFVQAAGTARIGDLAVSDTGFADMLDGLLECREVRIGDDAGGEFNQYGGLHTISDALHIGPDVGDTGAYTVHGGTLDAGEGTIDVGLAGTGVLHMEGGTAIAASITRGAGGSITASTPAATLRVNGLHGLPDLFHFGGTLQIGHAGGVGRGVTTVGPGKFLTVAGDLGLGYDGWGTLNVDGGYCSTDQMLVLGLQTPGYGSVNLTGGELHAPTVWVGQEGAGRFDWTGGVLQTERIYVTRGSLNVGLHWGYEGHLAVDGGTVDLGGYNLTLDKTGGGTATAAISEGSLSAWLLRVAEHGLATVEQSGGTVTLDGVLFLGRYDGAQGEYTLSDGTLQVSLYERIGYAGDGLFDQTGGVHEVTGAIVLGYDTTSMGRYAISDGTLCCGELIVGEDGRGRLEMTGSPEVTVSARLHFGERGVLRAAPGSTIHMTGSAFENESTQPVALAGLADVNLVFEGGPADVDPVEVGGQDRGPLPVGLRDNFALGGLTLGGADVGQVRLADLVDNQPAWAGAEALYVHDLTIGPGSLLDLNGLALYYHGGTVDPGATILGGTVTPIYTPATSAEVEGVPEGYVVTATLHPDGGGGYGTAGMTGGGDARVLSCTVELDDAEIAAALAASGADYVTLVIHYDEAELAILGVPEDSLRPYWWDDAAGEWVLGGTTTAGLPGEGVFAGVNVPVGDGGLGYCGVHTGEDVVWANINHASAYGAGGVIPEPATLALLALGAAGLVARRRSGSPGTPPQGAAPWRGPAVIY